MWNRVVGVCALVVVALSGCSSSDPGGTAAAPTTGAAAVPATGAAPAACEAIDGPVALADGRRMVVRRPATTSPVPAVVVLHGFGANADFIEASTGLTPFLRDKGVAAAYVDGTPTEFQGLGWSTGSARFSTEGVDDVAAIAGAVSSLVASACVDPARVALIGVSNGGAMALLAACDERTATAFRSVALVIPAIDDGVLERCGSGPALRFTALAGRRDRTITYDGVYPAGEVPLAAQEDWFTEVVAERNGCGRTLERTRIEDGEEITVASCPDSPTLVAIDDGTHTWPGSSTAGSDPVAGRFPATDYLWPRLALGG